MVFNSRMQSARRAAFSRQEGKCFYCQVDMWEFTMEDRWEASRRLLNAKFSDPGVKRKIANLKCTGEHLVKRADNGSNQDENIVAACFFCNTRRGDMSVEDYIVYRRTQMNETSLNSVQNS